LLGYYLPTTHYLPQMSDILPSFTVEPEGARKCVINFTQGGVEFTIKASVPADVGRFQAPKLIADALQDESPERFPTVAGLGETLVSHAKELGMQEHTARTYCGCLKKVLEFFGYDWHATNVRELRKLEGGQNLLERFDCAGGCAHVLRQARAVFSKKAMKLYERLGIDLNCFTYFISYRPRQAEIRPFETSTQEVEQIIARCKRLPEENPEFHKIYLLGMGCGLRSSEILKARFQDLLELNGQCFLQLPYKTKGGKPQKTGIPPRVFELLKDYETAPADFIVQGANRPKMVQREFVAWLRNEAGIEDRKPVHRLRKILGARVATQHGIYAAAKTLRHNSVTTTERYYADLIDHKNNVEV